MVNYQESKIYKIVSSNTDKCYVGSTTKSLSKRLSGHKAHMNCGRNTTSKQILELGNYSIELLELFPCNSKKELCERERYYIDTLNCVNKVIPCRTLKEWSLDNKEEQSNKLKKYRIDNKEIINAKRGVKHTCECGGKYTLRHKATHIKTKRHINYLNFL